MMRNSAEPAAAGSAARTDQFTTDPDHVDDVLFQALPTPAATVVSLASDCAEHVTKAPPAAAGTVAPPSRCQRAFVASMPPVFVVIWATGFIAARYAMPYSPPFQFLSMRFGISAACFIVWALLSGAQWPKSRAQVAHLAVTGVLMHAGYLGGVWASVRMGIGAGLASLIVGVQPVPTAIWVSLWGGKLPWKQWFGLVLGVGGLVLVVWQKLGKGEVTPLNLACCFVSLACITAGTLYQKRFVLPCDVRTANMVQLAAALCVALPIGLGAYPGQQMQWTDATTGAVNGPLAGSLAWSVLGLTLGGSSLLYMMIQAGAATAVSSMMFLVPPTTALMAWVLFGEPMTLLIALGIVCTVSGVLLVVKQPTIPQACARIAVLRWCCAQSADTSGATVTIEASGDEAQPLDGGESGPTTRPASPSSAEDDAAGAFGAGVAAAASGTEHAAAAQPATGSGRAADEGTASAATAPAADDDDVEPALPASPQPLLVHVAGRSSPPLATVGADEVAKPPP